MQLFRRLFSSSPTSLTSQRISPDTDIPELNHPFRAIIFDWDGTAVTDRKADASVLVGIAQQLLDLHVWIVVVTGTNFNNIDAQFCQHITPKKRHHLIICVNRGSEVYGFDGDGHTIRRWIRVATPVEDAALTATAEGVKNTLKQEHNLDVNIITNRLNRRKIDLIPLPEWSDPPKAQIGALLAAVNERLRDAHVKDGIKGVIELTESLAAQNHLEVRITSDVKHIEVGLTDKADSISWIKRELLQPEGIAWHDVLIGGDELGPVSGFTGSDDRLRTGVDDAVVISVGAEPNGVPEGVLLLGGGPVRFGKVLAQQVQLHQQMIATMIDPESGLDAQRDAIIAALSTTPDPQWRLTIANYDPNHELSVESQLAVSNGFYGTRGALELPTDISQPRTWFAGLFAPSNEPQPLPVLIPGPDWTRLRITVDGQLLAAEMTASLSRVLDMQQGVLYSTWQWHLPSTTFTMRTVRLASQANHALAIQLARFDVSHPVSVTIESWLAPEDDSLKLQTIDEQLQVFQTSNAIHRLSIASTAQLSIPDTYLSVAKTAEHNYMQWQWMAQANESALFSRIVAAVRQEVDVHFSTSIENAQELLQRAQGKGIATLQDAHADAWLERWQLSNITIEGDDRAQQALRFAIYHLISAANPNDPHVSIGARALTGEAYHGHVFWDTEIFLLPFYSLTWPAAAEAMLTYRFMTLPAARAKAASMGYQGALYAWESTDTGEETTPTSIIGADGKVILVRNGLEEQHISADIAYAVWRHWQATDDTQFMLDAGAEIVLETARFWASRAQLEGDGRYHIRGVIGPDEYHESIDDNAYTNVMAAWNIERGRDIATWLEKCWHDRWQSMQQQIHITASELDQWHTVATKMYTGYDATTHLYEQFAGFFQLEPIHLADYADRKFPMDIVLGHERTQKSQVVKQADVVMFLALLWDRIDGDTRTANFRYYEPLTGHGSSLSPAVHALVAARLGDAELANRYFQHTIDIDGADGAGNESQGVHIATQAGLWQVVIYGFAGIQFGADGLHIDPHLPQHWTGLQFKLQWQSQIIEITIQQQPMTITITVPERQIPLHIGQLVTILVAGTTRYRKDDQEQTWQVVSAE